MTGVLFLGFLLGLQHAMEADHLAALASLAARSPSRRNVVRHGVVWGLGHMVTLSAFAGAVILFEQTVGPTLAGWLEIAVGVMGYPHGASREIGEKVAAECVAGITELVEKMESIGTGLEKIGKARATGPQAVRGDFAAKGSVEALNKIPRTVVLDQMREVVAKAKDPGERRRLEVACIEMTRAMDKQG